MSKAGNMPKRIRPKTTANQRDRFIQAACQLECDENEDRFNATLKRVAPVKSKKDEKPSKD